MPQSIREVMTPNPVGLRASALVIDAARAMRERDIGPVIVLDDDERVCGIVTDRDIAVRVVAEGKDPTQMQLRELATEDLVTLSPESSIDEAVRLMREKAIRRLPVVQDGRPVGIVSIGDLAEQRDPSSALADISKAPPNN